MNEFKELNKWRESPMLTNRETQYQENFNSSENLPIDSMQSDLKIQRKLYRRDTKLN